MTGPDHGGGTNEAEAVLAEAVAAFRAAFGDRLLAAYALGSLAHGGFSPLVSDVDLGLILDDPLTVADAKGVGDVGDGLRASGGVLHERLSVFWGTPATLSGLEVGGRFPPLDRLDLLDHGRLLHGDDMARFCVARPTQAELVLAAAECALEHLATDAGVEEVRRPEILLGHGIRRVTKVVLFPVRFLFTAETGEMGTNDAAVEHHLAHHGPASALVRAGFGWRTAPPADQPAALALLQEGLLPLYRHFLEDHTDRAAALGRPDLAKALVEWRHRLDA